MGTDIHLHVERLLNGVWVDVKPPAEFQYVSVWSDADEQWDAPRDGRAFQLLAGIRGLLDEPPIREPRGLPGTACYWVKRSLDEDDGVHTISWLTLTEIQPHLDRFYPWYQGLIYFMIAITMAQDITGSEVRIVFGFDN